MDFDSLFLGISTINPKIFLKYFSALFQKQIINTDDQDLKAIPSGVFTSFEIQLIKMSGDKCFRRSIFNRDCYSYKQA